MRNKGHLSWEEYGMFFCICRSGIKKAKAHLELNLTRAAKNKKGFTGMFAKKLRLKKMYLCNK